MQNCPNCNAAATRQHILPGSDRQCTVCATIWTLNESGAVIKKRGQTYLAEIESTSNVL